MPGSFDVLSLTTTHPSTLPRTPVRASTTFYCGFTLVMVSSPGFGSITMDERPIQTWFPYASSAEQIKQSP